MNESTLHIGIEVDDNGSVVLRRFGSEVSSVARNSRTEFGALRTETNNLGEATDELGNTLGGCSEGFDRGIKFAGKLGVAFGVTAVAATALIWKLGREGLEAFADFESGMIGVQKTTDFTATEMDLFRGEIEGISRSVPIATDKLLGISGVAGQLGVKGVKDIAAFTETLGKLELSTDIVGEDGAASIARLLTVVGEGYDDVDDFGDVIVALGNNSAATESEILGLATEIAQATSTFNVGSTNCLAMGASMKSLGVSSELGGSVVGRTMRSIEAAIAAGGEKIEYLSKVTGIAKGDLKQAFGDDATAVFQKWLVGIGSMIKGGTSAADALGLFGLKGEEVLKVLPTMAVNSGVLEKALNLANDEVERGTALDIEAAKAAESLNSQWQLGKNRVNEISVAIGENLAPVASDIIEDFGDWYDANDKVIKSDLKGWIENVAPMIQSMAGFAADVGRSLAGWSAVASGRLDFVEFAAMDAEDLSVWLGKSATGVVDLENKIRELQQNRDNLSFWQNPDGTSNQTRIDDIDAEITKTNELIAIANGEYKSSWAGAYDEISRSHSEYVEGVVSGEATVTQETEDEFEIRLKLEQLAASKKLTLNKKLLQKRDKLAESLSEKIQKLTLSDYECAKLAVEKEIKLYQEQAGEDQDIQDKISEYRSLKLEDIEKDNQEATDKIEEEWADLAFESNKLTMSTFDQKKYYLDKEIAVLREKAGTDIERHKEVTAIQRAALAEIELATSETTDNMSMDWLQLGDDVSHAFSSNIGDALIESMGGIDNAWDALWMGMLEVFVETVAEMAATKMVSGLMGSDLVSDGIDWVGDVTGWYHDGLWQMKDDEELSLVQKDEMIIPSDESNQIRQNLLNAGDGSFGAIVEATKSGDLPALGSSPAIDSFLNDLGKSTLGDLSKSSIAHIATGNYDVGSILGTALNPDKVLNNVVAAGSTAILDYTNTYGSYANVGGFIGKLASMFTGGSPVVSQIASLAGSLAFDGIGDALDDREFEGLRDGLEDGYISRTDYDFALAEAQSLGIHHGSVLTDVIDMISTPFNAVSDFISAGVDLVTSGVASLFGTTVTQPEVISDRMVPGASPLMGYGSYAAAMNNIAAREAGFSGYQGFGDPTSSYDGGVSGNSGHNVGGSQGSSTGTGGGYNDGNGGVTGLAKGGVVKSLYVPDGDHGLKPMAFDEGVIDADTMKILQNQIRSGSFGGNGLVEEIRALRQDINAALYAVANNTRKANQILQLWDANGMPMGETI